MEKTKPKPVVLYESFNIQWLLQMNPPCFEGRTLEHCRLVLNNLKQQGYTSLRATANGLEAC